jgi:predicted DNA-binding transcriptional regulator AlpA
MNEKLILNSNDLADALGYSVQTIHQFSSKNPDRLPPRLVMPGRRRLAWAKKDVDAWVESLRAASTPTPQD